MNATVLNETTILDALREVVDPEIGVNIVDLGMIYDIAIGERAVQVTMTLTTPGCPMQEALVHGVRLALKKLPPVDDVQIDVVWDPPWSPDMITEAGHAMMNGG